MRKHWLSILSMALLAAACGSEQVPFSTTRMRFVQHTDKAEVELTVDYPNHGGEAYADSIRYHVSQWLGGSYEGSLDKGQELVNHYGMAYFMELEEARPEYETMAYQKFVLVGMECEAERFVSYTVYNETFSGGAHGFHTQQGYTFDKRTGELLSDSIIATPDDADFQQLLRQGLAEYFGPDMTVDDFLWMSSDELLPMPQCAPYLDKEGVTFIYQPYEIAPYAAGMPFVTISYSDVKPYLTVRVKELLSEE